MRISNEVRLFALGFVTLFLELAIIRYFAANIWNLGYFPNLVVIAVFVGMGIGFIFHRHVPERLSDQLYPLAFVGLLGLILFVLLKHPMIPAFQSWSGEVGGELFFTSFSSAVPHGTGNSWVLFTGWFFSVVLIIALISQRTAKVFAGFDPLKAYTLDILGSCAGILCFMLFSWLRAPAFVWFLVLSGLVTLTVRAATLRNCLLVMAPVLAAAAIVGAQDLWSQTTWYVPRHLEVKWSPYQKVEYIEADTNARGFLVNGMPHQEILPIPQIENSCYVGPYLLRAKTRQRPYRKVLIIGSGTGNDIVAALRYGAAHVDAVEIDPVIADFAMKKNPYAPYQDPRVRLIRDDGRSYLTRAAEKYDLIIFALTDSLVKVSPLAQLRLENYLFTVESMRRAYALLGDDGSLFCYNMYRRAWLVEKLRQTMYAATGLAPDVFMLKRGDLGIMGVTRPAGAMAAPTLAKDPGIDIATDDWPFLYLPRRGIPAMYLAAMGTVAGFIMLLMIVMQLTGPRAADGARLAPAAMTKAAFVLMGIAFFLLETKSIVQFSLLFGCTWVNSSLVFLSVLVMVLLANWTARWLAAPWLLPAAFALLVCSCLATLAYPLSNLLYYDHRLVRFLLAALITFSPVFFANIIFSTVFSVQKDAERLFGWNMLGATLGGIVEYFSMALGYNALALLVAGCYVLVFLLVTAARRCERAACPECG